MPKLIVLGFSFGHRGQEPGVSNEMIARIIQRFTPDIICVQWEIGKALRRLNVIPNHEIFQRHKGGRYFNTEDVAQVMISFLSRHDLTGEEIYIAAHQDHLPRVSRILRKLEIHAQPIPSDMKVPFDPKSHQIWTRSAILFRIRELLAFPLYLIKGYYKAWR